MTDIFYHSGIGDLFISDEQKKINESMLKDAELQRQQQAQMLEYLSERKAMYSDSDGMDQNTLLIVGGVAIVAVFIIIMTT